MITTRIGLRRGTPRVAASKVSTQIMAMILGTGVVALLAQVSFRLPFTPVPVTGQTLGVLLVGAGLGRRLGALTLSLYLGEGALGLPVFAGGSAGWPLGPTGGYLIGFIVMAYVVGTLAERGWLRTLWRAIAAMLGGEIVLYGMALPWLSQYVGVKQVVPLGLMPFIPGDLLKAVVAASILPIVGKFVKRPVP